ncbi:hypothetical protein VULLAG_LOCUS7341 [Vulpes lagopus]
MKAIRLNHWDNSHCRERLHYLQHVENEKVGDLVGYGHSTSPVQRLLKCSGTNPQVYCQGRTINPQASAVFMKMRRTPGRDQRMWKQGDYIKAPQMRSMGLFLLAGGRALEMEGEAIENTDGVEVVEQEVKRPGIITKKMLVIKFKNPKIFEDNTCSEDETICPKGWNKIRNNCFFQSEYEKTWIDGQANCIAYRGSLAIFNSKNEVVQN